MIPLVNSLSFGEPHLLKRAERCQYTPSYPNTACRSHISYINSIKIHVCNDDNHECIEKARYDKSFGTEGDKTQFLSLGSPYSLISKMTGR